MLRLTGIIVTLLCLQMEVQGNFECTLGIGRGCHPLDTSSRRLCWSEIEGVHDCSSYPGETTGIKVVAGIIGAVFIILAVVTLVSFLISCCLQNCKKKSDKKVGNGIDNPPPYDRITPTAPSVNDLTYPYLGDTESYSVIKMQDDNKSDQLPSYQQAVLQEGRSSHVDTGVMMV